jgi:hypothetical protein
MIPAASIPASSVSTIALLLSKALLGTRQGPSLKWKGGKKASPLGGEGSMLKKDPHPSWKEKAYDRRHVPLSGGRSIREKARHVSRESKMSGTWQAYLSGRSHVSSQEHAWRMRGSSPLPQTCRRHHYRGRRSNDRTRPAGHVPSAQRTRQLERQHGA